MNASQQPDNGREPPGRGAPLPVASPPEPPRVHEPMQPARAVSPEGAALLPPVGLVSQSRLPPPLARPQRPVGPPSAALADTVKLAANTGQSPTAPDGPVVTPTRHIDVQKKWAAAGSSSAAWTVTMVLTAIGVGAMAIIPLLRGGGEAPEVVAHSSESGREPAVDRSGTREGTASLGEAGPRPTGDAAVGRQPSAMPPSTAAHPQREAWLESELASIRRLLRERNTTAAQARIEELAAQGWPELLRERIESHSALVSAIQVFLANLHGALDRTGAGHTITWRGREAPIVDVTDSTVTILVNRRQVRLQRDSLSDEAVRALAEGVLDMNDPRNLAHLGAFLFVVEEDGSAQARRLWRRAAAAGEDVRALMGLLRP